MPKTQVDVEKHLPKTPPKKTGSRGIGPKEDGMPIPTKEEAKEMAAAMGFTTAVADTREGRKKRAKREPELLEDAARGKQARLPTMEDPVIEDLESAARLYADTRDKRMRLLDYEVQLKEDLLGLMVKNKKRRYVRDGVTIEIVAKEETVKVRIKKDED
jgi:hypothetical protein